MMLKHSEDLEHRETVIESMRISHEELVAKKEKEKQQLKARVEEAEVERARQQKELQSHRDQNLLKENEMQEQ